MGTFADGSGQPPLVHYTLEDRVARLCGKVQKGVRAMLGEIAGTVN